MSSSQDSNTPSSSNSSSTSQPTIQQAKLVSMSTSGGGVSKLTQSIVLKQVGLVSNSQSGSVQTVVVSSGSQQPVPSSSSGQQPMHGKSSRSNDTNLENAGSSSPANSTITLSASEVAEALNNNQISISNGRYISRVPISDDGMGHCIRCGSVGVKDTFYGKGKQFCSLSCVRGLPPQQPQAPLYKIVSLQVNKFTGNPGTLGDSNNQTMVTVAMPICSSAPPSTSTQACSAGTKKQQQSSSSLATVNSSVSTTNSSRQTVSSLPPGRVIIRQQPQSLSSTSVTKLVNSRTLSSLQTSSGQLFQLNPSQPSTATAISLSTVSASSSSPQLSTIPVTTIAQLQSHIQQQQLSQLDPNKKRNYSKVSITTTTAAATGSGSGSSPGPAKRVKRNSQSNPGLGTVLTGKKIKLVKQPMSNNSPNRDQSVVVASCTGPSAVTISTSSLGHKQINSQFGSDSASSSSPNPAADNRILINQLMRKSALVGTMDPLSGGVRIISTVSSSADSSGPNQSQSNQTALLVHINQQNHTQRVVSSQPGAATTSVTASPQQIQFFQQQLRAVAASASSSGGNSVNSRLAQILQTNCGPKLQLSTGSAGSNSKHIVVKTQPPSTPAPISETISQQIKSLDSAVLAALSTNSSTKQSCNTGVGSNNQPSVWSTIFDKYGQDRCAPVETFVNLPLFGEWSDITSNSLCYEIRLNEASLDGCVDGLVSPGTVNCSALTNNNSINKTNKKKSKCDESNSDAFWFVRVVATAGYYLRVRYVGLPEESSSTTAQQHDLWINMRVRNLYPVGYAKQHGFRYQVPALVEQSSSNHRSIARLFLQQAKCVNKDLYSQFCQQLQSQAVASGVRLEVIDRTRVSTFRVGTVDEVIGDRILVRYDPDPSFVGHSSCSEENGTSFWTHPNSGFVRPVGWSQLVGHPLCASRKYAEESLSFAVGQIRKRMQVCRDVSSLGIFTSFESMDQSAKFKRGMKLEVVDPSNFSSICVGTVQKLLRFNFMLISIDDFSDPNGFDWFCCHASSPLILPAGFCAAAKIELTPPPGFATPFSWPDYCLLTQSDIAPMQYFSFRQCEHGFREGMLLEAVDLVEPHLICVAIIRQVAGRLLRLHFIGWEDHYDQWCDCYSPNIFPVGYCELVEHPLQGPPNKNGLADKKRKSSTSFTRRKRKSNTAASKLIKSVTVQDYHSQVDGTDSGSSSSCSKSQQASVPNGQCESLSILSSVSGPDSSDPTFRQLHFPTDPIANPGPFCELNPVHCKLSPNSVSLSKHSQLYFQFEPDWFSLDQPSSTAYQLGPDSQVVLDDTEEQENQNLLESGYVRSMPLFKRFSSLYYREDVRLDLRADLRQLVSWTPRQVGKFLVNHNFDQFYDPVVMNKIDGTKLLMLTRAQAQKLSIFPKASLELFNFVQKLRAQIAIGPPE